MQSKQRNPKFWFDREKVKMKMLGLKPQPGSGSGELYKEDGEDEFFLCQLKSTEKESFRLQQRDLDKLFYHASLDEKIPLFAIDFVETETFMICCRFEDLFEVSEILGGREVKRRKIRENDLKPIKQKKVKKIKNDIRPEDLFNEIDDELEAIEEEDEDFFSAALKAKAKNNKKKRW